MALIDCVGSIFETFESVFIGRLTTEMMIIIKIDNCCF